VADERRRDPVELAVLAEEAQLRHARGGRGARRVRIVSSATPGTSR
jgi:hypothetical protein